MRPTVLAFGLFAIACALAGCAPDRPPAPAYPIPEAEYQIGPGDSLNVFVWRNPELSLSVPVRPDGRLSMPLVEDLVAIGRTPTALARDIEQRLAKYVRDPIVTVMVTSFVGPFDQQVRVVGEVRAAERVAVEVVNGDDLVVVDEAARERGADEARAAGDQELLAAQRHFLAESSLRVC